MKSISDWQFKQIVDALRILFVDLIKPQWAGAFPWQYWVAAAQELPSSHATIAKDVVVPLRPPFTLMESSLSQDIQQTYPELFTRLITEIRVRQYSIRTEQAYCAWVVRFFAFHHKMDADLLNASHIKLFLEDLVVTRQVSGSTQNQALNALVFFYRNVLGKTPEDIGDFIRANKPRRLPVVLSRVEVARLMAHMSNPTHKLMASLLYGCGMRLMECVRLRVFDVDFDYQQIIVRNAKGHKDRVVPLPTSLRQDLTLQMGEIQIQHAQDVKEGYGEVYVPDALARKYPNAPKELGWQYVFSATRFSVDPRSQKVRRHRRSRTSMCFAT